MALKDWHRTIEKGEIRFYKQSRTLRADSFKVIYVYHSSVLERWLVSSNFGFLKSKGFKTKSQAIMYAKHYMRKH